MNLRGCGSCSPYARPAQITYDAPPVDTLFRRVSDAAIDLSQGKAAMRRAVGNMTKNLTGPRMIRLCRFGRWLALCLSLAVDALAGFRANA